MESLQLVARITPTPPRLTSWSDGSTLWLFADILYRPSGWLRRLQKRPDNFEADLLSRRLDHVTRCKLLRHYSSAAATPFDHHSNADGRQLAELFSRGDIQLFRLPIEDHLMGAPDPDHHLFCTPPQQYLPFYDNAPTLALATRRNALAWELGEIVAAPEHSRQALSHLQTLHLPHLGRLAIHDEQDKLSFSLAFAARPQPQHYAQVQGELKQLGLPAPDSAQALEEIAKQGLAQLHMLARDPASERLLRDFFFPVSGWQPREPSQLQLGLDVPVILGLLESTPYHRLPNASRVGPFTGQALVAMAEAAQAVHAYNQHKALAAAEQLPEPVPLISAPPVEAPEPATELDPAQQTAALWQCRQRQIDEAKARTDVTPAGPEHDRLTAASERLERNMQAEQKALLSQHVYQDDEAPPPGWVDISKDPKMLDKYGLEADLLESGDSGFRARLYLPDPAVFGSDVKPTVVFKGTTTWEDWKNNIRQGFGFESTYYQRAIEIGMQLKEIGADVEFTGHSLGGGMASAAARASGLPAITHNAAGLHDNTLKRNNISPVIPDPDNILAYRVKDELLTGFHEPGWKTMTSLAGVGLLKGGPIGALAGLGGGLLLGKLMPDVAGTPHEIPGQGNPYTRHGIDQVLWGIEQQNEADEATLCAATGVCCT